MAPTTAAYKPTAAEVVVQANQIADAIALLARDPARRHALLPEGAERARQLDLLTQARGTLEVYRSVLAPPI